MKKSSKNRNNLNTLILHLFMVNHALLILEEILKYIITTKPICVDVKKIRKYYTIPASNRSKINFIWRCLETLKELELLEELPNKIKKYKTTTHFNTLYKDKNEENIISSIKELFKYTKHIEI